MFGKQRRARGTSAFGLALVAALACGALVASAAQASPAWHLEGKTLKERNETKAPINQVVGPVTFEMPEWGLTVTCTSTLGIGYIIGEDKGTVGVTAKSCSVLGMENECTVDPVPMNFTLDLSSGGETGAIETFTPTGGYDVATLEMSGEECIFSELSMELYYGGGSLGGEVSQNGSSLDIASSNQIQAWFGETVVYISTTGSLSQSSAYGYNLEAW